MPSRLHRQPALAFATTITTPGSPPNTLGFFLLAAERSPAFPLEDGRLCLGSTQSHSRAWADGSRRAGGGDVFLEVDFEDPSHAGAFLPGSTWSFQLWYSDSASTTGHANLTNAVAVMLE